MVFRLGQTIPEAGTELAVLNSRSFIYHTHFNYLSHTEPWPDYPHYVDHDDTTTGDEEELRANLDLDDQDFSEVELRALAAFDFATDVAAIKSGDIADGAFTLEGVFDDFDAETTQVELAEKLNALDITYEYPVSGDGEIKTSLVDFIWNFHDVAGEAERFLNGFFEHAALPDWQRRTNWKYVNSPSVLLKFSQIATDSGDCEKNVGETVNYTITNVNTNFRLTFIFKPSITQTTATSVCDVAFELVEKMSLSGDEDGWVNIKAENVFGLEDVVVGPAISVTSNSQCMQKLGIASKGWTAVVGSGALKNRLPGSSAMCINQAANNIKTNIRIYLMQTLGFINDPGVTRVRVKTIRDLLKGKGKGSWFKYLGTEGTAAARLLYGRPNFEFEVDRFGDTGMGTHDLHTRRGAVSQSFLSPVSFGVLKDLGYPIRVDSITYDRMILPPGSPSDRYATWSPDHRLISRNGEHTASINSFGIEISHANYAPPIVVPFPNDAVPSVLENATLNVGTNGTIELRERIIQPGIFYNGESIEILAHSDPAPTNLSDPLNFYRSYGYSLIMQNDGILALRKIIRLRVDARGYETSDPLVSGEVLLYKFRLGETVWSSASGTMVAAPGDGVASGL